MPLPKTLSDTEVVRYKVLSEIIMEQSIAILCQQQEITSLREEKEKLQNVLDKLVRDKPQEA